MKNNHIHVVPIKEDADGNRWAVKEPKVKEPMVKTRLKSAAIVYARSFAKERLAELVIHKKDGTIQAKDSFGNDPRGTKG